MFFTDYGYDDFCAFTHRFKAKDSKALTQISAVTSTEICCKHFWEERCYVNAAYYANT